MKDVLEYGNEGGPMMFVWQALVFARKIADVLNIVETRIAPNIGFDKVSFLLLNPRTQQPSLYFLNNDTKDVETKDVTQQMIGNLSWRPFDISHEQQYNREEFLRNFPKSINLPPYEGLGAYCFIPLKTKDRVLGGMELIKLKKEAFSTQSISELQKISTIISAALDNILERTELKIKEQSLNKELEYNRILVNITNATLSKRNLGDLSKEVAESIHNYFGFDYISLDTYDFATHNLHAHSIYYQDNGSYERDNFVMSMYASLAGESIRSKQKILLDRKGIEDFSEKYVQIALLADRGFKMILTLPLISGEHTNGVLKLGHKRPYMFTQEHLSLLDKITSRLAIALDNAIAYEEISALKEKLANENQYLIEEIETLKGGSFEDIVGNSSAVQALIQQIEMVAASDATVLILGETGTGKELVANAIHRLSNRNSKRMVKINCTAVPSNLLESELFGHEKGAFTGAMTQRIGRFELADKSTLFLDEIGDLPLDLQPKFLRVLQEHEIERLGGNKVIPVDVRIIAATNVNLQKKVLEGEFRSDLFYRLNVFPLIVPPLRERREDIPLLVNYFVRKISQGMKRNIDSVPSDLMAKLIKMPWLGNIRELENFIERAVILSRGHILEFPNDEIYDTFSVNTNENGYEDEIEERSTLPRNLPKTDRASIIKVLRESGGVLGGRNGAAARLGLKRTTLISRMQRLGIEAKDYRENTE